MSSLIFVTEPEQVLTGTDTLATSPVGEPAFFTTKAFIVPHLNMIMCGTGMGGFLGKWFIEVNDRMLVRGIDNLDYHTPERLLDLWLDFKTCNSVPDNLTTTIYHFGFSEEDRLIHSYAYRSVSKFSSESLTYGMGIKPECISTEGLEFPGDIRKIMDEQRLLQQSRPKDERIYIGGEIQIHHLTREGFVVYVLDQFEDFEVIQNAMFDSYLSQEGNTG
ncbi:MAG TPA: hypothetical protein G4O14_03795 [Anaerolineae bacterium]|nr:hypothetical protein [Anaerolineae bacterium]